jgi:RNA exonuclease 1
MTAPKRKRDSREPSPSDFGLGATLARLDVDKASETQPKEGSNNDDQGWTRVVSKKRRHRSRSRSYERDDYGRNPNRGRRSSHERDHDRKRHASRSPEPDKKRKSERKERDMSPQPDSRDARRSYPVISFSSECRPTSHITIPALQDLILHILADGKFPRGDWVKIKNRANINQVVVLMVPGLEVNMFNGDLPLESEPTEQGSATYGDSNTPKPKRLDLRIDDKIPVRLKVDRLPSPLKPLADVFEHVWPIRAKGDWNKVQRGEQWRKVHSPIHTMLVSPVLKTNQNKIKEKRTPVTEYLLSLADQQENNYVIHPAYYNTPEAKEAAYQGRQDGKQSLQDGWVDTNVTTLEEADVPDAEIESGSILQGRHVIALDCEMCVAEDGERVLTRVSVVDWDGGVLLTKLVKPDVPIKDYSTEWSGITEEMLRDVDTTIRDVQKELLDIINPRTIIVGHSLESDLNALKLTHPFLIDTTVLFPHPRPPHKQSLKYLCREFLHTQIQNGKEGHHPTEDALSALQLVKEKCERGPQFGVKQALEESIFKRFGRTSRPKSSGANRAGAFIDWGKSNRAYAAPAQVAINCQSDAEVAQGIEQAVKGLAVGEDGATTKVDFVWAHLRELEFSRGWWDGRGEADLEATRQAALKRSGLSTGPGATAEVTGVNLGDAVSRTVDNILQIYESLPRCTALIVYSGTGEPHEYRQLLERKQKWENAKKLNQLSETWGDKDNQLLDRACKNYRNGVGLIAVK